MPKILILIDWFEPGYRAGGPIRSIVNLVSRLQGFDFHILTSNKDHFSDIEYDLPTGKWVSYNGQTQVCYLKDSESIESALTIIFEEMAPDVVYVNSLFSSKFSISALRWLRKNRHTQEIVLAPRGMLKAGALSIKANKKKLFLKASRLLGWYKNIKWHATNEAEAQEIKQHYGQNSTILVAPNLSSAVKEVSHPIKESEAMKLIMIARVSKEKNILGALQYLSLIASRGKVVLDVYGTLQDPHYHAQCLQTSKSIDNAEIRFLGEIPAPEIEPLWEQYHFLYSPTLGENYGHAIVEAFLHGLPAIISDKTPWRDLASKNAGWDCPLQDEAFAQVLLKCLEMNNLEYLEWCNGAIKLGSEIANDKGAIEANRQLFLP